MSRQLQNIAVIMLLLFGLFAGTGQGFAFEHKQQTSCLDVVVMSVSSDMQQSQCEKDLVVQTCPSDGAFSFFLISPCTQSYRRALKFVPFPDLNANLIGTSIPPASPPPIPYS